MSDNPFESPKTRSKVIPPRLPGVLTSNLNIRDLRKVAIWQKVVLVCLLIYVIALFIGIFIQIDAPGDGLGALFAGGGILVSFVACFFVFMISVKVYGAGLGVFLGLLTLVPVVGLVIMLVVNAKVTVVMKSNYIDVGLFGADLVQIDELASSYDQE